MRRAAVKNDRGEMHPAAAAAAGVVAVLVVFLLLFFGGNIFSQKTANFRGETSKRNQVEANGQFRINAYDHFFDLCTSVQADEARIRSQEAELKTKPSASRQEEIQANLAAIRSNREASIAQYNNDAGKDYTTGQFLSNNLPPRLDPTVEVTTCSV